MKKNFAVLVLIFVCFLAYGNSLRNQFLLDDYYVLFGKDGVENLKSPSSLFTTPRDGFFRPVGYGLLRICYLVFGDHPFVYHLANLFLFAALCILIFLFVLELAGDEKLAFLTSLIYAVHPINQTVVNFASFSSMATYPIFMLLSMICVLRFLDSPKKISYFLTLLFLFMALLSHEMAVLFPVYFILIALLLNRGDKKEALNMFASSVSLVCFFLLWRASLTNPRPVATVFGLHISLGEYFGTLAKLIFWYLS